jgi:hypothetical protein
LLTKKEEIIPSNGGAIKRQGSFTRKNDSRRQITFDYKNKSLDVVFVENGDKNLQE